MTDQQFESALDSWAVFPMTRLRPEQVVGGLLQACSAQTIDSQTHILLRIARSQQQAQFVRRYGDSGEDEFMPHGGSIPQRLLMLNGNLLRERTKGELVSNASAQMAVLAPDDRQAVRSAYLAILTRLPTPEEAELFESRLDESRGVERMRAMEDIYATLLNVSEFSWNH